MHFQKVEAHTLLEPSYLKIPQSLLFPCFFRRKNKKFHDILGSSKMLSLTNNGIWIVQLIGRKKISLHLLGHTTVRDISVRTSFTFGIKLNYLNIIDLKNELLKHIFLFSYSRGYIFLSFFQ